MKNKLLTILATLVLSHSMANGVVIATNILANTGAQGLVTTTLGGTLAVPVLTVTGSAYYYTSTTQITAPQVATVGTKAQFEALIAGDSSLRTTVVTSGAITPLAGAAANLEVGAAGRNIYVWMQSTDGTSYGLFQAIDVPNLGTVNITPTSVVTDWIGTSVVTAAGTDPVTPKSGWQLYSVIPEPSAALLGAVGALLLLRRRRI